MYDDGLEDDGDGKNDAANMNHIDPSLQLRQGLSTVFHPYLPQEEVGKDEKATPCILHTNNAPTKDVEQEVSGLNYTKCEGVEPNLHKNLNDFDDYLNLGDGEDDSEDEDLNPTE